MQRSQLNNKKKNRIMFNQLISFFFFFFIERNIISLVCQKCCEFEFQGIFESVKKRVLYLLENWRHN